MTFQKGLNSKLLRNFSKAHHYWWHRCLFLTHFQLFSRIFFPFFFSFVCLPPWGVTLGKGGSKIKEIRESTGCSIQVASDMLPNSTEREVKLTGTAEQITQCIFHICCVMLEVIFKLPPFFSPYFFPFSSFSSTICFSSFAFVIPLFVRYEQKWMWCIYDMWMWMFVCVCVDINLKLLFIFELIIYWTIITIELINNLLISTTVCDVQPAYNSLLKWKAGWKVCSVQWTYNIIMVKIWAKKKRRKLSSTSAKIMLTNGREKVRKKHKCNKKKVHHILFSLSLSLFSVCKILFLLSFAHLFIRSFYRRCCSQYIIKLWIACIMETSQDRSERQTKSFIKLFPSVIEKDQQ